VAPAAPPVNGAAINASVAAPMQPVSQAPGKGAANPVQEMLNGSSVSSNAIYLIGLLSMLLYFYVCIGLGGASVAGVAAFTLFWARSYFLEVHAVLKTGCLGAVGDRLAMLTLPTVQPPWGGGEDDLLDAFEEHLRTVQWLQRSAGISAVIDAILCIWAFSYAGIRVGLETKLFEGFEVSIACAYMGLILCIIAVLLAITIEVIGSLRFSEG